MNFKLAGAFLPLAAASAVVGASSAEAASLTGSGNIGFSGAVRIFAIDAGEGRVGTAFDFRPTVNAFPFTAGDDGRFVIGDGAAEGGFSGFNPDDFPASAGEIGSGVNQDLALFQASPADPVEIVSPVSNFPVEDFVILEGGDDEDTTFRLDSVETAVFEEEAGDLIVRVQVEGVFFSSDMMFPGSGVYTAQFEGVTQQQFLSQLAAGGEFTRTYSADYVAEQQPDQDVPEPTSVLGLAAALGLAASSFKKKVAN